MFDKIAIVNRGEPAMRLIRAVEEFNEAGLGIRTVAFHVTEEAKAAYVLASAESYDLGPVATRPFLDLDTLEAALVSTAADAAWVGWGFVAENPAFARMCERLGVTFIGPSSIAMRRLGDKIESKHHAAAAGAPVAPWSEGPVRDLPHAIDVMRHIHYPAMLKATAGGGGRGIRVLRDEADLRQGFDPTRREAMRSFGSDVVFIERLLEGARHLEVQAIADSHGHVWPVAMRDCSIQRKQQKIIEESGTPAGPPDPVVREIKAAVARMLADAGYCGVATVEFLYQPESGQLAFLEVNTRLQVEHPVTEMTTGFDLVKAQIEVAAGRELTGKPPVEHGHAIEARLNAEDADRAFAPAPGQVQLLRLPAGPGIRVDCGVREGDEVRPEFDSMIAKIVAWGRDRPEALARLTCALKCTTAGINGGTTNRSFLVSLLGEKDVISARADTGWVDRMHADGLLGAQPHRALALATAAILTYQDGEDAAREQFLSSARGGRPELTDQFTESARLVVSDVPYTVTVTRAGPTRYRVVFGDLPERANELRVDIGWSRGRTWELQIAGESHLVTYLDSAFGFSIDIGPATHRVSGEDRRFIRSAGPGVVVARSVQVGDRVEAGQPLLTLEAMKMESTVVAVEPGVIAGVLVGEGDQVGAGQPLVQFEAASGSSPDSAAATGPAEIIGAEVSELCRRQAARRADGDCVEEMRALVLGFESPRTCEELLRRYWREMAGRDHDAPLPAESALLRAYIDLSGVTRKVSRRDDHDPGRHSTAPHEYLHRFTQTLDCVAAGVPESFRHGLTALLCHHGVDRLDSGVPLDRAVHRTYVAHSRARHIGTLVEAVLRRWASLAGPEGPDHAALLDRLVRASREAAPTVCRLARSVRHRWAEPTLGPEAGRTPVHRIACASDPDHPQLVVGQVPALSDDAEGNLATCYRETVRCLAELHQTELEPGTARPQVLLRLGHAWQPGTLDLVRLRAAITHLLADYPHTEVVMQAAEQGEVVLRCRYDRHLPSLAEADPQQPLDSHDPYAQKVERAGRRGYACPYDIAKAAAGERGSFVELDLDVTGQVVPVDRPAAMNTSGIVLGVVTTPLDGYPEGASRVLLVGDPTHSLGALSEPECRRVVGAIDLAEKLRLPLEWFALSAGARIAMEAGTENLDWIARALRRIVAFTQAGGEINVVVAGINVGGQPYWNAEATMLMHARGVLIMTPASAMVLTGKEAMACSGGISGEDNFAMGGYHRIMGPNGEAQYWAAHLTEAIDILRRHYSGSYVARGEQRPRRAVTADPLDRDITPFPHAAGGCAFRTVGEIFSPEHNPSRKQPFDIRTVMRAVADQDRTLLERWPMMAGGESAVVLDAFVGGWPVCMIGIESRPLPRADHRRTDGPATYAAGTLFPQSSKKIARGINAASGRKAVVVLANLAGFDGSPESLRNLQLEYGAEIGRAVVNFSGPIVFCVISRYHGGAFVVFSKTLNDEMTVLALEGSFASVIGGTTAATVVLGRQVDRRTDAEPAVQELARRLAEVSAPESVSVGAAYRETRAAVRVRVRTEVAAEFDQVHSIERAVQVDSVDEVIRPAQLRPKIISTLDAWAAKVAEPR
jgi:acetyl/propionyl-CoA carboxylase alpha subunit/acetyl-CoA carboxylase carboxyltransferase component